LSARAGALRGRAEALLGPCARLGGLDLAVAGRRGRDELVEQRERDRGDLVDRPHERGFVRFRRRRGAADLAHVLERSRADLVLGGRWVEGVERLDVSAHGFELRRRPS
jgi:hypothetical protein